MNELNQVCDSSHEGNGRPGAGIIFPAVEKLLNAVSALMDICDDTGADRRGALALVTRRENELIKAAAKHDAKVASLRAEVERLKAPLTDEEAELAEELRAQMEYEVCEGDRLRNYDAAILGVKSRRTT